eukprot:6178502-Pleurochrysis_carterae.AAC.1
MKSSMRNLPKRCLHSSSLLARHALNKSNHGLLVQRHTADCGELASEGVACTRPCDAGHLHELARETVDAIRSVQIRERSPADEIARVRTKASACACATRAGLSEECPCMCARVRVCTCALLRACPRGRVRVRVRACVRACARVCARVRACAR